MGGAIYGGAVAVLIPHSGEGALLVVLVLAVAPLAFVAAINPSLNVATVTAIIVLLLPAMNHGNPLDSAIDRVLEVAVGALTGLAVSFLVLPSRAHSQIRASAARVLELMASALNELLSGLTRSLDNDALHDLQDGIGTALVGLNAIGAEAERERAARLSTGPDTGPLLRTILRLRHDLVMIGRASVVPLPADLQQTPRSTAWARQQRDGRISPDDGRSAADRQGHAGDLAGAGRTGSLRRRGRRGTQRWSDARRAGRRRGAVLRAGIFARTDAAEFEGSGTLRGALE